MALTLTLSQVDAVAIGNKAVTYQVTVANTGSASVTLSSLQVSESTESDAQIGQPNILTPQVPVGLGNPTISASSSVAYTFDVIWPAPNTAGPSPNAPGPLGMSGMSQAPADASFTLQAQAQSSDGSVSSTTLAVPVLSATSPFPVPQGGALQFSQGANLVNGLIIGAP